jgi:hypothetical protein
MDFWFEFLKIDMKEKNLLAMISMALDGKKIKLSKFDYFSLWFDTLFGLLDCDYTW